MLPIQFPGIERSSVFSFSHFEPWRGVFETIWIHQGVPIFWQIHWKNFLEAANALQIPHNLPVEVPPPLFLQACTGRLRLILDAEGRLYHTFNEETPHQTQTSFSLGLALQRLGKHNWDARYKTLSYLTHTQARLSTSSDEALLLNEDGHVVCGSSSNLFWLDNSCLHTPPLSAGCRNGAVRQWILSQLPVQESLITPEELLQSKAIAITNSRLGIQPISAFLHWTPLSSKLFDPLIEAYKAEINRQIQQLTSFSPSS
ncbi:MAG: aminotransferase class IV [Methylacidiphilales bacterium]|nr:aminotransferase class IV [Candidatus Methylacidiphilales bacterium]